jgi:hypothetical protein
MVPQVRALSRRPAGGDQTGKHAGVPIILIPGKAQLAHMQGNARRRNLVLKLWNESGTNRARIATLLLSEFVHGNIWWHGSVLAQNRVAAQQRHGRPMRKPVNTNFFC